MAHGLHTSSMSAASTSRVKTPPPPPATMTPPPSSSHPATTASYPARTPTPTNSHLSSPPPTIKTAAARHRSSVLDGSQSSSEAESAHGVDQLRNMLAQAQEDCVAAKTAAAHYRFQLELNNFDASECMKRMEVELEMTAREVDVLQHASRNPTASPTDTLALRWKNRCLLLEIENDRLRADLGNAKALIVEREDRNVEETDKLKKRIHDNRMRMNQLRGSGLLFGEALPSAANRSNYTSPNKARNDDPFGDLLLADQMLRSQAAASTPNTPLASQPRVTTHARGQLSLASLPSTPYRSAPRSHTAFYTKPLDRSPPRRNETFSAQRSAGRQRSRDSTISASEAEDEDGGAERIPDSEGETEDEAEKERDVPTSQASQEAANMLRKSTTYRHSQARKSVQITPTKGSKAAAAARPTSAGQMYGYQILKGGAPGQTESIKRRFYDEGPEAEGDAGKQKPKKKGRSSKYAVDGENAGLGLGLNWSK